MARDMAEFIIVTGAIIVYILYAFVIKKNGKVDIQEKLKKAKDAAAKQVKSPLSAAPQAKFARNMAGHEEHQNCLVTGAGYSGYAESLKTLHKSGLVTTAEMHELLNKHNL